jgi:cytochrome c-type protein NapB
MDVPGLGFAPPTPHGSTPGMSLASRCQQCHVYKTTDALFVESDFAGAPQSLRRGERLYTGAPPVAPHGLFLREDCLACHAGPAARAELVCTHPDRARCLQCHAMPPRTGAPIEDFQR